MRLLAALPLCALLAVTGARAAVTPSGLPDPHRTPGAVNPSVTPSDLRQTICVRGYTRTIRPPVSYTEPLKRRQLHAYVYPDQRLRDYEEDHLVPLEVGGAPRNPRNLWPEPRYGLWSAARKDRLENRLHYLVCHGRISLRAAQAVFERDWIAGYRRYLGHRRHARHRSPRS